MNNLLMIIPTEWVGYMHAIWMEIQILMCYVQP